MSAMFHGRRGLPRALGALLLGLFLLPPGASAAAEAKRDAAPGSPLKPNIIFILADDLGYGDLGCYGQKKIKTPNLDRMAAQGMRFNSMYSGSTVCAPSRCALMTGLHTGHCLIRGNAKVALRPEDTTVAELLQRAGYQTALIGKWGLGNEDTTGVPQRKGFDHFVGYLDQTHAHDYYPEFLWRHDPRTGFSGKQELFENREGRKAAYTPDLFTRAATNFVRIYKPQIPSQMRPFFLFLSYTIPHANNEETRRSNNGMEVPSDAPYSDESWPQPEKNKAAMITRMDRDIGALFDTLKAQDLDEDTVVFFSSDNGPHREGGGDPAFFQSSGPLRGIKRDLYEGGIRVPMIVRWPGTIRRGQTNEQPWAFWDILPTLTDIAGVPAPKNIDGISMLPALRGQAQTNQERSLYWEFHERGFQQAARTGDWKALKLKSDAPLELYNLRSDIGETNNVASQNAEVVARFDEYFKTARTESGIWPREKPAKKKGK